MRPARRERRRVGRWNCPAVRPAPRPDRVAEVAVVRGRAVRPGPRPSQPPCRRRPELFRGSLVGPTLPPRGRADCSAPGAPDLSQPSGSIRAGGSRHSGQTSSSGRLRQDRERADPAPDPGHRRRRAAEPRPAGTTAWDAAGPARASTKQLTPPAHRRCARPCSGSSTARSRPGPHGLGGVLFSLCAGHGRAGTGERHDP